jgi:hypothetical protein
MTAHLPPSKSSHNLIIWKTFWIFRNNSFQRQCIANVCAHLFAGKCLCNIQLSSWRRQSDRGSAYPTDFVTWQVTRMVCNNARGVMYWRSNHPQELGRGPLRRSRITDDNIFSENFLELLMHGLYCNYTTNIEVKTFQVVQRNFESIIKCMNTTVFYSRLKAQFSLLNDGF